MEVGGRNWNHLEVSDSLSSVTRRGWSFAKLLRWHMDSGTRPDFHRRRWSPKELSYACGVSDRAVRGWLAEASVPANIEAIELSFFGEGGRHAESKEELRRAWSLARAGKGLMHEPTSHLGSRRREQTEGDNASQWRSSVD
jgi:hypothetical protein